MSRIISYPYDDSIKAKDAWVGTDEASRQTKQYTAEALAEYLNISGSISIIGQMTYKYGTTPLNGIGTLAVFGGGPDIVAFSAVVKLTLSNQDISNQRVVEFLDLLVGSDILIAEQGAISTFGYYSIDSYAINATDSNYYDLGVTFKSGNGSMRSDRIYEAQNFVLANDATQSPWNTVPDGISYTAANVGIGTVTPSEKLEVSGGIIGDTLFVRNTDGYNAELLSDNLTTNRTFNFPDVGGTLALTTDITSSPWDTVTGGINYANGNVGIGTASPSVALEVQQSADNQGLKILGFDNESNSNLHFYVDNFGNDRITSSEFLNITSGGSSSYTSVGYLRLRGGGTSSQIELDGTLIKFTVTSSEKMRLTSTGLGIGTTSPSEKLEVAGQYGNTTLSGHAIGFTRAGGNYLWAKTSGGDLRFTVNGNPIGSASMIISSSGNVGIGATSPSEKLEVTGNVKVDKGSAPGKTAYLSDDGLYIGRLSAYGGGYPSNIIVDPSSPNHLDINSRSRINLKLNNNTVLVANDSGNVGIGTTTPSEKLEVTGPIGSTKLTGYKLIFTRNANNEIFTEGASSTLTLGTNSVERMRINSAGNVGIGTTSPLSKFQVNGQASVLGNGFYGLAYLGGANALSSYDTANKIVMSSNGSTDGLYTGGLHLTRRALTQQGHYGSGIRGISVGTVLQDNALELYTSTNTQQNATRLKITSTGNVGIGTTTPSYPFVVKRTGSNVVASFEGDQNTYLRIARTGTQSGEAQLRVTNNGNLSITSDSNISLKTGGVSGTTRLYVRNNDGNVGIGTTSPAAPLSVVGSYSSSDEIIEIGGGTGIDTDFKLKIGAVDQDYIWFQSVKPGDNYYDLVFNPLAGNVGIGTTSPSQKLEVAGNVKLNSGALIISGTPAGQGAQTRYISGAATTNDLWFNVPTNGRYRFAVADSQKVEITAAGNVGIGTTSPTKPLDVRTDIGVLIKGASGSSNAKISLVPASGGRQYDLGNSGSDFRIFDASAGITRMHFDNDGNTGIGTTTPSQKLEVDGQVLSDGYRLAAMQTAPATRNSTGTLGEIVIDGNHIYVCYATDSWSRVALETSW